ncbi:MAG: TetR family transcriptional regulator C-terminal domain-containing protein [Bacteroidota bacterium]
MELYQKSLGHYKKETGVTFQRALLKAKNPLEAIRLIFEGFLPEMLADEKGKGCFIMNCKTEMANQEKDVNQWLLRMQEDSLALFQDLIEDGQQQGLINKDQDAESYAYFVFSSFQGFRMTGILVKDKAVLQNIIGNTIRILM